LFLKTTAQLKLHYKELPKPTLTEEFWWCLFTCNFADR